MKLLDSKHNRTTIWITLLLFVTVFTAIDTSQPTHWINSSPPIPELIVIKAAEIQKCSSGYAEDRHGKCRKVLNT